MTYWTLKSDGRVDVAATRRKHEQIELDTLEDRVIVWWGRRPVTADERADMYRGYARRIAAEAAEISEARRRHPAGRSLGL